MGQKAGSKEGHFSKCLGTEGLTVVSALREQPVWPISHLFRPR